MKTLVFISAMLLLVSCDVYYVDPVPVVPYDARDQFVGKYNLHEYSSTYDEYWDYYISVYKGAGGQIVIDNFYNSNMQAYATINGNRFYVNWQTIDGYEMQGDGFVEGDKFTINYKIRDTYSNNSAWDFCSATGWLQ